MKLNWKYNKPEKYLYGDKHKNKFKIKYIIIIISLL